MSQSALVQLLWQKTKWVGIKLRLKAIKLRLKICIVRQRAGPHISTEMLLFSRTFKKFVTLEMVNIIVWCTKKKAECQDYNIMHLQNEQSV